MRWGSAYVHERWCWGYVYWGKDVGVGKKGTKKFVHLIVGGMIEHVDRI